MKTIDVEKQNSIIELYREGKSTRRVASDLKISKWSVNFYLKKYGVVGRKRKHYINERFFETINTPEKAQIFGMLCADGNIRKDANTVRLSLKYHDEPYLEKICELMDYTKPLEKIKGRPFISPTNKKKYVGSDQRTLTISCKKIHEDCIRHGLVPRKSWLDLNVFSNIHPGLLRYFILGYYEGDGCITRGKRNFTWYIVCRNKLAIQIKYIIREQLGIECRIQPNKNIPHISYVCLTNIPALIKLYHWLYTGSELKMDRKYLKYQSFMNMFSQKGYDIDPIIYV